MQATQKQNFSPIKKGKKKKVYTPQDIVLFTLLQSQINGIVHMPVILCYGIFQAETDAQAGL